MGIVKEERIGNQRLILGDCLAVMPTLGRFDAVVTDPPYGMNYTGSAGTAQSGMKNDSRRNIRPIVGDDRPFDPSPIFDFFPKSDVLMWGGDWFYSHLPSGGTWIVWDKRASPAADSTPGAPFEVCWSRQKRERTFIRYPWGGWISKEIGETERWHPTQKPVEVMRRCLDFLPKAKTILDPFMGSGTTLVACQRMGRQGTGIELDPDYFAIACKRVDEAARQPDLFVAPEPAPVQGGLEL